MALLRDANFTEYDADADTDAAPDITSYFGADKILSHVEDVFGFLKWRKEQHTDALHLVHLMLF